MQHVAAFLAHHVTEQLTAENLAAIGLLWATVLFAGIVTYARTHPDTWSTLDFLRHLLPVGTTAHPSARADVLFWLSRRIFMPFFVLPLAISTVAAGHIAYWLLTQLLGAPAHPPSPAGPGLLIAFTVTMLLAYDLSYYLYHRMQHEIPILWELHKVHHSAEVMVGVTKDRVHPLDELMNRWWDGLIPGLCYGVWMFFAMDPVEVTIFGLNVYMLRNVILMMDFVRHTHLKLSFGPVLDRILLSPHYHQLHHSVAEKHWDKNYGLALSIWDRMFGTLVVPEADEDFVFGLAKNEHQEYQSLYRLHVLPIQKILRRLRPSIRRHHARTPA
ncbi:MAG TPA: sterol desaturase family protein [Rhodopila sp.]|uniref:sterol desaturase family protein n=1 Tax=Rhodopila sp. TaxID=2480087 RepID=UPI002C1E1F21|nr:sterol desaturase family protein [Rhodopila sp.]HVY14992.1 sterol desaturase family protein [Rhodopila sp.]